MPSTSDLILLGIGYRHVKGGEDEFAAGGKKIRESAKEAGAAVDLLEKGSDKLKDTLRDVAAEALALAAAYLSVHAAIDSVLEGVKLFAEFDSSIAQLRATTQATAGDMDLFSDAARAMGASTDIGAARIAAGMTVLSKAGETTSQVLRNISDVEHLADIAHVDYAEAADQVALSLARFNLPADQAAHVVDVLAATSQRSRAGVGDLVDVMKQAGPAAGAMGLKLEDLSAALGVMSQQGGNARASGGALLNVLAVLSNPTKQVQQDLRILGLSLSDLSPRTHSLTEIIETLARANLDAGTAFALFGHQGGAALLQLTQNIPALLKMRESLNDVDGVGTRLADDIENNLASSGEHLEKVFEAVKLSLGAGLAPALSEVSKGLQNSLREWQSGAEAFGAAMGRALTGTVTLFVALVDHGREVTAVLIGIGVGVAAIAFAPLIAGAYGYIAALVSLAATEGVVAVATMELSLAWDAFTAALVANPITLVAVALGALAAILYEVVSRNREAAKAEADYQAELASSVPKIDGVISAHAQLAAKLQEEIDLRQKLSAGTADLEGRYVALTAVGQQMTAALQSGDQAGYQRAVQSLQQLGVTVQGNQSALEAWRAEMDIVGKEVKANADKTLANNERIATSQKSLKESVVQALDEEVTYRLLKQSQISDAEAKQAQAEREYRQYLAGSLQPNQAKVLDLKDPLADLQRFAAEAEKARQALAGVDAQLKLIRGDAAQAALSLLNLGNFEAADRILHQLGATDEQIQGVNAAFKKSNEIQAQVKAGLEAAARAREDAIAKQREQARLYADEIKAVGELTLKLNSQIAGHRAVAAAFRESYAAGVRVKAQTDDEAKATEAASKFTGARRQAIHDLTLEELQWARTASQAEAVASLRLETDKALAAGAAKVRDAVAGNADASTAAATAYEIEDFRVKNLLKSNDPLLASLRQLLEARDQQLKTDQLAAESAQRRLDYEHNLAQGEAAFADALGQTTVNSRAAAVALDVENQVKALGNRATLDRVVAILNETAARHKNLDTISDEIAAAQKLASIHGDAGAAVAINQIGAGLSDRLLAMEQTFLETVRSAGNGSVAEGVRVLQLLADKTHQSFDQVVAGLKADILTIQDAAKAAQIRGAGRTALDIYQQERADIERLMTASTGRIHITVADGLKALEKLQTDYLNSQLSSWSSLFSTLSQEFGGVFTKLLRFVQILQEIQQIRADVTNIISGLTSSAGQGGGAAALTGSATALTGSATALTGAATGIGAVMTATAAEQTGAAALLSSAAGLIGTAAATGATTTVESATVASASLNTAATALLGSATALDGAATTLAASGATSGAGGLVSGGGSAAGAGGYSALAGYAVAAFFTWIGYNIAKGFLDKGPQWGEASLGGGRAGNNSAKIDTAERAITELVAAVQDLAKQWDLGVVTLKNASVTIGRSGAQFYVKTALDSIGLAFSSYEQALDYAKVQALKFADYAKTTSELVVAVIHNTRDLTTQQLNEDINVARQIDSFNPAKTTQSIHDFVQNLEDLRTKILQLVPAGAELAQALANLNAEELRQWRALSDSITGRQATPQEQLADKQEQAREFNAEKALRLSELKLKALELQADIARVQARGEIARAGGQIDHTELTEKAAYLKVKSDLIKTDATLSEQYLLLLQQQLDAINALIDGLSKIPDIDPNAIKLPSSGGKGSGSGQSLADQVREAARERELSQATAYAEALAAINDKWDKAIGDQHLGADAAAKAAREHEQALLAAGKLDKDKVGAAMRAADERYQRELAGIAKTQAAIAAANKEREAEIALLKQQTINDLYGKVRDFEKDPNAGSTPQGQLAELQAQAQTLRDEFQKTGTETGLSAGRIATGLARITAAEIAREKALAESVISGLGLPFEATREKAKGLGDSVSFLRGEAEKGIISVARLNDVLGQVGAQATTDLLGQGAALLEQEGRFDDADKARRLADQLNFELQKLQFNFLLDSYEALGILTDAQKSELEAIRAMVNDPANQPDFTRPAPQRASASNASPSGNGSASASNDDARRQAILDQIAAWNELGKPEATKGLRDLNATFVSMSADAQRLGVSLTDLIAAHAVAVEDFWNKALAPYEASGNLLDQVAEINKTFSDLVAAAQQYGGDQARIEADRLKAVEKFWDAALQPIKDLKQQLAGGQLGGVSPEAALAAARANFYSLAGKAQAGDSAAIQAIPAAIQTLLDQQRAFSGTGPAYQALVATIQGVLDQILGLGTAAGVPPLSAAPPAALVAGPPAGGLYLVPSVRPAAAPDARPGPLPGSTGQVAPTPDPRFGQVAESLSAETGLLKEGRKQTEDLRAEIDRLVDLGHRQEDRIEDLLKVVGRLTSLIETQERRATQGRKTGTG